VRAKFLAAGQLLDEIGDSVSDLVADRPDVLEVLVGWVVELPVFVVFAWE
jgi:hypothetical protein